LHNVLLIFKFVFFFIKMFLELLFVILG